MATQLIFIFYELIQMRGMGLYEYGKDIMNYNDLLNFALFVPIYV